MTLSTSAFSKFAGSPQARHFALLVIAAIFILTRMQYWVEIPIPNYNPDSETFLAIAFDMGRGITPHFDLRTPGYPLFLYATLGLTDSILAVIVLQQLITLASACALCVACSLLRPSLALVSLVPCLAIVGSQQTQLYELLITSESTYSALLVFAFAGLLGAFATRSKAWLLASSVAMGLAILYRPAGMFLVGTYALTLGALWFCRLGFGRILAFAIPLPAILLALCAYNQATLGKFTVSPFGPANLAGATATYWHEVPGFPEPINAVIRESQTRVSAEHRRVLREDWNAWKLDAVYHEYFNEFMWRMLARTLNTQGIVGMAAQAPYYARLCRHTISQEPLMYAKFVYTSLYMLVGGVGRYEWPDQADYYARLFGSPPYLSEGVHPAFGSELKYLEDPRLLPEFRRYALREYVVAPVSRAVPVVSVKGRRADRADLGRETSVWASAANQYDRWLHRPLYVSITWVAWPLMLAAYCSFVLLRHRREEAETAALGVIVSLSLLGSLLLVALVEEGLDRYAFPTRFLFYLAPVLLLSAFLRRRSALAQ